MPVTLPSRLGRIYPLFCALCTVNAVVEAPGLKGRHIETGRGRSILLSVISSSSSYAIESVIHVDDFVPDRP